MSNKIEYYLNCAAKVATRKIDHRSFFIGAVAIRSDGAIVSSCNQTTKIPNPFAHAEAKIIKKLDYGAILYIARVLRDGTFAMAKPCNNCITAIKNKNVSRVYFTISSTDYDCINL